MRVRSGLITAIYQKALVLSNDGRSSATGDIVNLMSVDAARLQDLCTYGLISISGPYQVRAYLFASWAVLLTPWQIMLAFISLYNIMGWPAFVGVGVMVVSIPLNTMIARLLKRQQEQQMKNRDKRTRLMSDLLNNIRRSVSDDIRACSGRVDIFDVVSSYMLGRTRSFDGSPLFAMKKS